jgi:hypothetical protein
MATSTPSASSSPGSARAKAPHPWKFFRAGGCDQVRLERGADLMALDELDLKLWVALACPARGLEFDSQTLDLIDTDKDGRIRAPDIIAAARWAGACLKNPDTLLEGSAAIALANLQETTPEGQRLLASAKQILTNLGLDGAVVIRLEDTADPVRIFAKTVFNGDGIVPAAAASDAFVRGVLEDILATLGGEADRSGHPGVSVAKVEAFFAEAQAFSDWCKRAETDATLLPFGERTPAAVAAVDAVGGKVDDFFARCRLAAYDGRALAALNRSETDYLDFAAKDLTITASEVAGFPLARIEPKATLALEGAVNPAWAGALARLRNDAVHALFGSRSTLTEAEWTQLTDKLAPYRAWMGEKGGARVEVLGVERVRKILASTAQESLLALLAKDWALEPEANAIAAVDKLLRYHRDLHRLLKNFVNFRAFYGRKEKAVFQAGTLYLDQRSCELCLRVDDMGRHATLAGLSRVFLAYCDLTRRSTGEKMTIAAAFTNGDSDNLLVGRNGVFFDREGRDWDATIVKLTENPISIRQAFFSPYKKFLRLIESQIEKFASAREKSVQDAAAARVEAGVPPEKSAKQEAFDVAKFAGIFAAIGLAMGFVLGAVGSILGAMTKLTGWQIPLVIVGLVLAISGPSMLIAWLKLRQRNLGPILDANGWAVNAKAKLSLPFGRSLTSLAVLPPGSQRELVDPYEREQAVRNRVIGVFVAALTLWALWHFGALNRLFPWLPRSSYVQQREQEEREAKAATPPAPESAPAEPAGK